MAVRDKVLEQLETRRDEYISGGKLSTVLGVSRNAIWKAVKSLESDGYMIDAVPNKGYRLLPENDIISNQSIGRYLIKDIDLHVYKSLQSTNTTLRKMAEDGAIEGTTVISQEQTKGRGRMGRSFFSPKGDGIYLSILLKPNIPAHDALFLTTCAAVAVCKAIEKVSGKNAKIKWVNDIYIDGKKACGILTEASYNMETGKLDYAVLGIGINCIPPDGGYPEEIADIASSVFDTKKDMAQLKSKLIAYVINYFFDYYEHFDDKSYVDEYIDRSCVIGKEVEVTGAKRSGIAKAIGIDRDCRLEVVYPDGYSEMLSYGEVSIHISKDTPKNAG